MKYITQSRISKSGRKVDTMKKQYDVVIIGAGVVGSAIARELSRYKLSIAVLEKIWMFATRPVAATLRWCTAALPTPLAA